MAIFIGIYPDAQTRRGKVKRSPMKLCLVALGLALGLGCVTRGPGLVKTQIVTFPDGALVEYNGQPAGRAPAQVTLPQDSEGRLTEKAVVRLLPNSDQPTLYPQERIFDPAQRTGQVPNRIMVNMTRGGTNEMNMARATHIESDSKTSVRPPVPYTDRGKPTQAVGLDRWKPGIY